MKKFLRVIVSLLLIVTQIVIPLDGTKTYAADLSDTYSFITGVQLTDLAGNALGENIAKDSDIRLTYTYAIPNTGDVKAGDTFSFQIPEQIKIEVGGTFDLLDDKGDQIGTGTLSSDGTVAITFSNFAENHSNITGSFWFELGFDADKIGLDDPTVITFDVGASTTPVSISVDFEQPEPLPASIVKSGTYDADKNEITWILHVDPENVSINNAVVSDVISEDMEFVDGSVTIGGTPASVGDYTYESGNFTYTFPDTVSSEQVLTFQTKVKDSVYQSAGNGASITEKNTATLSHDGISAVSNEAEVTIPVSFITKTGTYNATTRQIDWTILVNQNGVSIPDAVVTDTLPDGLTLDSSTVKIDNTPSAAYTYVHPQITFSLGAVAEKHIITFSTDVESSAYTSNVTKSYLNKALLTGTGVPDNTSGSINVGVPSNIIRKEGVSYNRVTGEITWKITVNSNQISIQNPVVTDDIPAGQEYVTGSAVIDNGADSAGFTYTAASEGDTSKTGTLSYIFGTAITASYTIEFRTKVTDPAVFAGNADKTYQNTASLTGDNILKSSSTGNQRVYSQVIQKTGAGYDYATRTITWKVVVNGNQMTLDHAVFTDQIPLGMEYVAGSAVIDNGGDGDSFAYVSAPENDMEKSGTLTYTFPDQITKTYTITFQTQISDLSIFDTNGTKNVENTGVLTHDLVTAGISVTGTQTIENTVISKTGSYTAGNKYIEWVININSNEVPLTDTVISDQLQEGLALDTASVRLFHQSTAANGSLVTGDEIELSSENIEYDLATRLFTFHLPSPASGGYKLTFQTNVTDKSKSPFTNEATFSGTGTFQTGSSQPMAVNWSGSGSTGSYQVGSIRVYKVDAENVGTTLEGATFDLIDKYGNTIQQGTTGEDGSVLFDMLRLDVPYTVKEISAPTGYNLNSSGYTFVINGTDTDKDITYQYADAKIYGNIHFFKQSEDKIPLAGAEFTLYDKDGNNIATKESEADGEVLFTHIPYGDYTIKETAPPEGYLLNDTILTASVKNDGITVEAAPSSISDQKIKGTVKVTKVSAEEGSPLAGAEFTVYARTDTAYVNPIASAISGTDGTALFHNLPYGEYNIRETKAPVGYQLSDKILTVQISEDGKLYDLGTYSDILLHGRIQVKKTDKNKNPLKNAAVSLYDKSDTSFSTPIAVCKTDENGMAYFEDVPAGIYQVKETEAPEGYLLSASVLTVTVGKEVLTYDAGTIEEIIVPYMIRLRFRDFVKECKNLLIYRLSHTEGCAEGLFFCLLFSTDYFERVQVGVHAGDFAHPYNDGTPHNDLQDDLL